MTPELEAKLVWARQYVESLTPAQYAEMIAAQKQSFIRAMAPCEHGDPDWETCPECLAKYARKEPDHDALR